MKQLTDKQQYKKYLERMQSKHIASGVTQFTNSDPITFKEFKEAMEMK